MLEGFSCQSHAYAFILIVPRQLVWLEFIFILLFFFLILFKRVFHALLSICKCKALRLHELLAGPYDKRFACFFIYGEITKVHLLCSVDNSTLGGHGDRREDVVASGHDGVHFTLLQRVNNLFRH